MAGSPTQTKQDMRLDISKRIIKAGDVLEVTWNAEGANAPRLILRTGQRESSLAVPESGTKRFRMKGKKGPHSVSLTANEYGRERSIKKRVFVHGHTAETDEFEYVDRGDASPINRWNSSMQAWWRNFTPEKKRLYIILLLLLAYHAFSRMPSFAEYADILFYGIIFWIFWKVVKR